MKSTLRIQSILFFTAAIAFCATLAGGGLFYFSMRKSALHEAQIDAAGHADSIRAEISDFLNQNLKAGGILANLDAVTGWMAGNREYRADDAYRALELFQQGLGAEVCYLMNLEGIAVAASNRNSETSVVGKNYAFQPYFQSALLGKDSVYMAMGLTSGTRGFYASQPVRDRSTREIIGVAVVESRIEEIEKRIRHTHHDHRADALIVDPHGVVFMGDRKDWLFKTLWPIGESETRMIRSSHQFGGFPVHWIGLRRTGENEAVDRDGRSYLLIESSIPEYPGWRVVHLSDFRYLKDAAISPALRMFGYGTILFCLIIAGALITLFRYGREDIVRGNRLREKLEQQADYLRTLHNTALGMIGRLSIDKLLVSLLDHLKRLTNADEVAVYLAEEDGRKMVLHLGKGPTYEAAPHLEAERGEGLVGRVWESGSPLAVDDYSRWPHRLRHESLNGFRAAVGFPILLGDSVIGVLLIVHRDEMRRFSSSDLDRLEKFADLAAVALDNAVLVKNLQKALDERGRIESRLRDSLEQSRLRQEEVQSLLNGARAVMGFSTFENAVRALYKECRSIIGATAGYVSLIEKSDMAHNALFLDTGEYSCALDENAAMALAGLPAEVCRTAHAIFDNRFSVSSHEAGLPAEGHMRLDNVLLAPIAIAGKTVGLIALANKPDGFTENDRYIAATFGELAALTFGHSQNVQALQRGERRFRTVIERIADAIMVVDTEGRIRFANPAAEIFFGRKTGELEGTQFGMPITQTEGTEIEIFKKDGSTGIAELRFVETEWEGNAVYFASLRDITERRSAEAERRQMEAQFRQVQKLEAIGTLAGGIAHDFNNILSAVIGFSQICIEQVEPGTLLEANMQEVLQAGRRAKFLVRQILAFSRQAEVEMQPLLLQPLVKEVLKMIRASIPTTIEIRHNLTSRAPILADGTQIHQVLMNLCTNAAHAMQKTGGILNVTLKDITLDSSRDSATQGIQPGEYVRMTVADNGSGIDAAILERIFDPFFTTKEKGEGTGMGLSVVHGIVRDHGGAITVKSGMEGGTRFEVFLPVVQTSPIEGKTGEIKKIPTGTERILVVDDEAPIVKVVGHILGGLGYTVTPATRSPDALALLRSDPLAFDLLVTDMTMPHMTGKELARQALALHPALKVIICTGFSNRITEDDASAMGVSALVAKPILKDEFAATVRRVLDGNPLVFPCRDSAGKTAPLSTETTEIVS